MKGRALALVIVAGAAACGLVGWRVVRMQRRVPEALVEARLSVAVMPVVLSNIETIIYATGNIEAWQEADIAAQVADNVHGVYVQEGDVVTAGFVLAVLADDQARATYEAAVAARKSGEAEVVLAETSYTNVATQFERTRTLYTEGVVGRQAYDDAETAMLLARGRLDVARAQLRRVEAAEEELRIRLQRYRVLAPFEGVVARRYVDPGAYAGAGMPIVRLVQINPVKVVADIPETQAEDVRRGLAVRVNVDAAGAGVTGVVARVYPTLDARWRTRTVEIACQNDAARLRPGMFARIEIVTGRGERLLVPDTAVLRLPGSGLWHVYAERGGVAERVDVEVLGTLGPWRVVRGALAPGARVIVKGAERVQSGMMVDAVPVEILP